MQCKKKVLRAYVEKQRVILYKIMMITFNLQLHIINMYFDVSEITLSNKKKLTQFIWKKNDTRC